MLDIQTAIDRSKREILEDIESGIVPNGIHDFSELHDYIDANEYGGLCDDNEDATIAECNEVQNAVNVWLLNR